jgi:hypothetical protein
MRTRTGVVRSAYPINWDGPTRRESLHISGTHYSAVLTAIAAGISVRMMHGDRKVSRTVFDAPLGVVANRIYDALWTLNRGTQ